MGLRVLDFQTESYQRLCLNMIILMDVSQILRDILHWKAFASEYMFDLRANIKYGASPWVLVYCNDIKTM